MECQHCNRPILDSRPNKKFCSNSCKTLFYNGQKLPISHSQPVAPKPERMQQMSSFLGLSGNPSFDYIFQRTERENDQLKAENRTLTERLETEREKYRELKLKVDTQARLDEADKIAEQSKGLGGFVDKVTSNDRLMGVLEKIALAKFGVSDDQAGEDMLEGVEENKMLLQTIVSLIQEKDQEFLAHFVKATQYFAVNPTLLYSFTNSINKKKIETA